MSRQLIQFDDGVRAIGGLSLAVARDQSSYDSRGNVAVENRPRYGRQRSCVDRQTVRTLQTLSGSGTLALLAGGVDKDGVTPMAFGRLSGAANGYRIFRGLNLAQTNTVDDTDLLEGIASIGGQTATHSVVGAKVFHGMFVTLCRVTYSGQTDMGLSTVVTSTNYGTTWTRIPILAADQYSANSNYPEPTSGADSSTWGNEWALTVQPIGDAARPLACWICWTDYLGGTDGKDGGTAWIARCTRANDNTQLWSIGTARRVYTNAVSGSGDDGEHFHSCVMAQDPATGYWYAVIICGDGNYNRIVKVQIGTSDGTDYTTATLTETEYWSGDNVTNGSHRQSIQPTAAALDANGNIIAGSDNEAYALCGISAASLGSSAAVAYPVGPMASTQTNQRKTINLKMEHARDVYGDLYVCTHKRDEASTPESGEESAIASLDGINWFQIGDPDIRFPAGPYVLGCLDGSGIVGFDRPTASTVREFYPLEVQPGATNQVPSAWESSYTDDARITAGTTGYAANVSLEGSEVYKIGTSRQWPSAFDASGNIGDAAPPGFDTSRALFALRRAPRDITGVTQANPGQVTCVGHGMQTSETVTIRDVAGMTELNGNTYTVTYVDADNFTIGTDTTGFTAYSSGGTAVILDNAECLYRNISDTSTGVDKTFVGWINVPNNAVSVGGKFFSNLASDQAVLSRFSNGSGWSRFATKHSASGVGGRVTLFMGPATGEVGEAAVMVEGAYLSSIPCYPTPYGTSSPPNEVATVSGLDITSGADYAISVDVLWPIDWGAPLTIGPITALVEDASNYVLVSIVDSPSGGAADGFPYDLKVEVTNSGGTTNGYIDGAIAAMPGAQARLTIARVGSNTIVAYQSGEVAEQSVTVARVVDDPVSVKLGSDEDGATVNALEFGAVAAAETAGVAKRLLSFGFPRAVDLAAGIQQIGVGV